MNEKRKIQLWLHLTIPPPDIFTILGNLQHRSSHSLSVWKSSTISNTTASLYPPPFLIAAHNYQTAARVHNPNAAPCLLPFPYQHSILTFSFSRSLTAARKKALEVTGLLHSPRHYERGRGRRKGTSLGSNDNTHHHHKRNSNDNNNNYIIIKI